MSFSWTRVGAILRKELRDYRRNRTAQLRDLVHAGYQANWFCFIASHVTGHAAELDRQTTRRLLALPGDLWLDVCGDGLDDDEDDG
ncbi:MAG: hypothetical protein WBF34_06535 [Streptosporangiaceae bacterium]|jgi:hypothetical protein